MEFGQVSYDELSKIDFTLPPDPDFNIQTLNVTSKKTKVYVGLAKWGREEWVAKLYPAKTKEKTFLDHYIQLFNSIEYNASHYKIYGAGNSQKKAAKAIDKDFFSAQRCFKVSLTEEV